MLDSCIEYPIQYSIYTGIMNVNLIILVVPPGAPSTLQVNTIGSQFTASVIWTAPAYLGLPPLSEYEIEVTSEYGTQTLVTNDTVLALTGLYPGTVYMVSVKAVSEIFPEGGDEIMETFETDLSS